MQETPSNQETSSSSSLQGFRHFFQQYKTGIGLGVLVLYLLLLGLGTVGEVWEVEWILDLPLFRPPGKY
ncbi:hypothetical protein MNBD_NITROSPINAE05-34 [hydrothermal vent metagenome]|uniref:Uncharacterized protein n=1 Tax=hydrothermal vent metagenome TaxID=652676 RepID=A0A3B1D255_9ZZZZ